MFLDIYYSYFIDQVSLSTMEILSSISFSEKEMHFRGEEHTMINDSKIQKKAGAMRWACLRKHFPSMAL